MIDDRNYHNEIVLVTNYELRTMNQGTKSIPLPSRFHFFTDFAPGPCNARRPRLKVSAEQRATAKRCTKMLPDQRPLIRSPEPQFFSFERIARCSSDKTFFFVRAGSSVACAGAALSLTADWLVGNSPESHEPVLASLFTHLGISTPISFTLSALLKWLQFSVAML